MRSNWLKKTLCHITKNVLLIWHVILPPPLSLSNTAGTFSHPSHPYLPPFLPLSTFFSASSFYLFLSLSGSHRLWCLLSVLMSLLLTVALLPVLSLPFVLPAGFKSQEYQHKSDRALATHTHTHTHAHIHTNTDSTGICKDFVWSLI